MFELLKYRRGQIRGIDFSLAMIIFLLTMAQVLVLTTTFIENSQSFQTTSERQEETNNFAEEVLYTTGSYSSGTDWSNIPTNTLLPTWQFGLADNKAKVDPFKLNRLAENNLPDYAITYEQLSDSVAFENDFQITTSGTIDVDITNVEITVSSIDVSGSVTNNGFPISNVEIWVFVYEQSTNSAKQDYLRTNSNGIFSTSIAPASASEFVVVSVLANHGVGNQDLDYVIDGNFIQNNQTLFRNEQSSGYSVNVSSLANGNDEGNVNFLGFYGSNGAKNITSISNPTLNDTVWINSLTIPPTGMVGILTHEVVGTSHYVGYSIFPVTLDNDTFQAVTAEQLSSNQSTVTQILVLVREILLEFTFTKWE